MILFKCKLLNDGVYLNFCCEFFCSTEFSGEVFDKLSFIEYRLVTKDYYMDYLRQYNDLNIYYEALKKASKQGSDVPESTAKWLALVETTLFELQELAYMEKAYMQKSKTMSNLVDLVYASAPTME